MRFIRLHCVSLAIASAIALGFNVSFMLQPAAAQETTGGMQGTVTDSSGAVVPKATVTVTTPTLVGSKVVQTDAAGYYRFANLPPGSYTIVVKAQGFETLKRQGVVLEVGHLPTINLALQVGAVSTVVEVKTEGPLIDETTTTTLTNIPEQALSDIPHGVSFQSVIQFAPAARNEPLQGSSMLSNGSGSTSPGNGSNGGQFGYSIGGGADSENSYLVEGQETANIIGGYSHTNVPMDFIQEVQMKTSGVEAEYGGALGGVVNVIMDKGTNKWHGSVFTSFQDGAMNGALNPTARYDPSSSGTVTSWGAVDPTFQVYQPIRPKSSDFFPGVTIGGPLAGLFPKVIADHVSKRIADKIYLFAGYNPQFDAFEETLNYGPYGGRIPFSQNYHTDYANARLDIEVTQKIRVFASWLAQDQKEYGESLPSFDSVQGYYNTVTGCSGLGSAFSCSGNFVAPSAYAHTLGYSAPNLTLNTGADITLSNTWVATSRFGYYFENYHDFGYPTTGALNQWFSNGGGANTDTNGNLLSSSAPALAQSTGYLNQALDPNFTHFNSNKAIQFDQDVAWFHSGGFGTHNLKFGYQLHRNSNYIFQGYNAPLVEVWPGTTNPYTFQDATVGGVNCAAVEAQYMAAEPSSNYVNGQPQNYGCVGTYGTVNINDFGTGGAAVGFNHGFYGQDAWTVGKGVTINYGIRIEREYLPAENQPSTAKITQPINFGWGDKIAPRIGAAWDVFKNGKMKVFGGYGMYFDQMKLNVAISSYGGQYWQECWYALMEPNVANILPSLNSSNRYCVGPSSSSQANFSSGTPSGLVFLENQNLRAFPTTCSTCSSTQEGTAPGLKPYAQHDSTFGVDYQISPNIALEARWDRRRLDHVIEDSAIFNPSIGETFVIVNPGQGVNSTFNGFYNFLYGTSPNCGTACPPQKVIPAARSYDGLEIRVVKQATHGWMGMLSYTYSNLRGNYTGLTSSDVADGGGGRNSPNNSRSFDEPYFSWNANGGSSSGLLPTDRPNALKGYAYYQLPWLHNRMATDFGVFQSAYSGSPLTSYLDVGYAFPSAFPTDIVDRGKWIDVHQDSATGAITTSAPYTKRTPAFLDTDFNFKQQFNIGESKSLAFDATFTNLLNQHSVTSFGQQIDSGYATNFILPGGTFIGDGPAFYAAAMTPYNYLAGMNAGNNGGPITVNSQYGKPYLYQVSRNIRLALHFTF